MLRSWFLYVTISDVQEADFLVQTDEIQIRSCKSAVRRGMQSVVCDVGMMACGVVLHSPGRTCGRAVSETARWRMERYHGKVCVQEDGG